jgi:hypothetical protein
VARLPSPLTDLTVRTPTLTNDIADLGHAVHAAIRPAALLSDKVLAQAGTFRLASAGRKCWVISASREQGGLSARSS